MAHQNQLGTLDINGYKLLIWNDGKVYDPSWNVLGSWNIDNATGAVNLLDPNNNLWATVTYDGANYVFASADSSTTATGTWEQNPNYSGSLSRPEDFITNTYLGSVTIGGQVYDVTDDGSGRWQLWFEGNNVGYAEPSPDGTETRIFNPDGSAWAVVGQDGSVTGANGLPMGNIDASPVGVSPGPSYRWSISSVGPDGKPITYYLGDDGISLYDSEGNVIGSYVWDGANGFTFRDLNNQLFGTFDATIGLFTGPDGVSTAPASWSGYGSQIPMNAPITQTNISDQTSTNIQGVDWSSPISAALQDQLISGAQALPGLAEQAGVQAQDYYTNLMGRAMGQQGFQGTLNRMAGRGMLDSSLTEGALAQAQNAAGQAIADKAFQASLAGTQAQMQVPQMQGSLISQLGGTSGTQSNQDWSQNITTDPLRWHNTWLNYLNLR
jgi:hypothetical protein